MEELGGSRTTALLEEVPLTPLGGRRTAELSMGYALVLEGRDGYTELEPHARLNPTFLLLGRYRRLYRVDLKPRELRVDQRLPSNRRARQFRASIRIVVGVDNPARVVEHRVEDPWAALEPILMPQIRQLSRRYGLDDLSELELALQEHLTGESGSAAMVLGLGILRASVALEIDADELVRARDKLQDEHYQEMEELRTEHQARLEQMREQQQRLLDAARAKHERELAELREQHRRDLHEAWQKSYRGVADDPLHELILAKLTTRPGGIDQKDLDEVIRLLAERRWEEYAVPLQLLSQHEGILQDWQREKLIEAVLNGLAAAFPPGERTPTDESIEAEVDQDPNMKAPPDNATDAGSERDSD